MNLEKFYPEAKIGDGVIVDFIIACQKDEEIYLNITDNVVVWYDNKCIYDGIGNTINTSDYLIDSDTDYVHLPIWVNAEGRNFVRVFCAKEEYKDFGFQFLISVKRYPRMWANDYLFWARVVLPIVNRRGEEGVALSAIIPNRTYNYIELNDCNISYAWPPQLRTREVFDFMELCSEGDVCYVYTEVSKTQCLAYRGTVECIWVNEKELPGALKSPNTIQEPSEEKYLSVEAGDKLLFKCSKVGEKWEFSIDTSYLLLPFLISQRGIGDKAIFIGPFYGKKSHAPEYEWDFSKVFVNEKGEQLYWHFCDNSELRIYLDSVFFGQWFYALMVGFYGIRDAAILLEDKQRQNLFCENMSMMAKYFDYVKYDIQKHVMPAFMPRLYEMNVLDNIGTMGMNLIDAYLDCNNRALLPLIDRIKYQAEETVPRMEDGTYYRIDTMWADDLYMSCPFLVRMGRLTGDNSWYLKAREQIRGFKKRLYMEKEGLFSHIYFPNESCANNVLWGRGNGWIMWTLSELLMYGDKHIDLSEEKKLFYDMAQAIRLLQDESGLWHQVLNRTDAGSYLETSCTGMFLLAFTRGVKYGWLGKEFLANMEKAWKGLLANSIDKDGNVYGVCMGSGCAMEAEYYFSIPTTINDDHGTGVILAAGAEYCALLNERKGISNERESV